MHNNISKYLIIQGVGTVKLQRHKTQTKAQCSIVYELLTWKTTCLLKVCLTQLTTYSVSLSVNSAGFAEDLNNGPRWASSGTAANCSAYTSCLEAATAPGLAPGAAEGMTSLTARESSVVAVVAKGTVLISNGTSDGSWTYCRSARSRPTTETLRAEKECFVLGNRRGIWTWLTVEDEL